MLCRNQQQSKKCASGTTELDIVRKGTRMHGNVLPKSSRLSLQNRGRWPDLVINVTRFILEIERLEGEESGAAAKALGEAE